MPKVFAVVVTFNGEKDIAACLESLQHSTPLVHIMVVDNASTDSTLEVVHRVAPEITLLGLKQNLGFGRANNIGIKYAYEQGAEHVLLLNQDAYLGEGTLEILVNRQQLEPEFGILSPLHLDGPGKRLDTLFCRHLAQASSLKDMLSDLLLGEHTQSIYPVEFIGAAIWLLSRRCVERVGLFNPVFHHYGEDMEYADRVRFHGLCVGIVPNAFGFHGRSQKATNSERTIKAFLLREKAIIRYRLSRRTPGVLFNTLSALTRAVFSKPPNQNSFLSDVHVRAALMLEVILSLPRVLRMKRVAYRGHLCFFSETEQEKQLIQFNGEG